MRNWNRILALMLSGLTAASSTRAQPNPSEQPPQGMPGMQHRGHQSNGQTMTWAFPRIGKAQEDAGVSLMTLSSLQQLAADSNHTLRQAETEIRAARARQQQSGLYPNPTVGYTGDEIRGGSVGGGKQGFFLSQPIVTAGKLAKNRRIFGQDVRLSEIESQEQKLRVENAVRIGFYRVLAAQELLDARLDLARISEDSTETAHRLRNSGQADDSEVLQAEVESRRTWVAARVQETVLREEWRALAALVGRPEMSLQVVEGNLEADLPQLNEEQVVEAIVTGSPAVRIASISTTRAQAVLERARAEPRPDLQLTVGAEHNGEQIGGLPRSTGWEGLAEVGVTLPLWNHNQGNITAARQDVDRAQKEEKRVELMLRERAASAFEQYAAALVTADEYRNEILPRARQAYSLLVDKHGKMLASRPAVLSAQRILYELHIEYVETLRNVWTQGIALQGFLLTDGLEAPARPGEVDLPVRETNLPATRALNPQ